ncbi:MAG: hypothetical protein V4543_15850, partial [Bacteroidota bacterium]
SYGKLTGNSDQDRGEVIGQGLELAAELYFTKKIAGLSSVAKTGQVAEEAAVQYTKSNLQLGRQMHNSYKVGSDGIKEFRLPSGKRIDLVDINNGIIYELKPFNPRAMQQGQKQLQIYLNELQSPDTLKKHPELKGINWKTILDTY